MKRREYRDSVDHAGVAAEAGEVQPRRRIRKQVGCSPVAASYGSFFLFFFIT
jgi:hypothetical protein